MWTHIPYWRMPSLQISRKSRWWQVMQPLSSEHRTQPVQFSSRLALAAGTNGGEGLWHRCRGGSQPCGSPSLIHQGDSTVLTPCKCHPTLSAPQIPTSVHAGSKGTHGAIAPSLLIIDDLHHSQIQTEGLPHAQHCPWVTV